MSVNTDSKHIFHGWWQTQQYSIHPIVVHFGWLWTLLNWESWLVLAISGNTPRAQMLSKFCTFVESLKTLFMFVRISIPFWGARPSTKCFYTSFWSFNSYLLLANPCFWLYLCIISYIHHVLLMFVMVYLLYPHVSSSNHAKSCSKIIPSIHSDDSESFRPPTIHQL